jgi:phage terminase large subunit-like protein
MARPKKKKPEDTSFSLDKMLASVAGDLTNQARKPNIYGYEPHGKQIIFHNSQKKGRQYVGGNRSGKTTGGIVEDIWWLTGTHPYRKTPPPPVIGRVTTVDFKNGVNKIILPHLKQWLPVSYLINGSWEDSFNSNTSVLTLDNGSELEIMSYEQDLDKFAGVPRHFIHFDEEPPKNIYGECKARLVDYGGSFWLTMTPVDGMTWTYDEIFEPSIGGNNPLIDVVVVDMTDNPHIGQEEIAEFLEGLDEEERIIRGKGEYIAIGGLVFKFFNSEQHVIDPINPYNVRTWTIYQSLDHGFNNPTAWLWHAVSSDGIVITFDEHYKSEMTVEQHAKVILAKEQHYREQYGITPFLRVADPAVKQRSAITGYSIQIEYSLQGLDLALGQLRSVDAGLNRMNTYLQNNKWYITSNCPNLLKEMRKYKRKTYMTQKLRDRNNAYEEPMKKDDHAIDSARYFFSFMPELAPLMPGEKAPMSKDDVARLMGAGTTFNPAVPINLDFNLGQQEIHIVHDEYVGEW